MASLANYFKKYTGVLRGWKIVYTINNLLNRKQLAHNKELYKKYGLERSIFGSVGKHLFDGKGSDIPWVDQQDALAQLQQKADYQTFDKDVQAQMVNFIENGFMVLKGFYDQEAVTNLNDEVEALLAQQKTDFNYTGKKIMDAYKTSELINQKYFRNAELLRIFDFLQGKKTVPFQTINFIEGSEQRAHSDSIHMTTQPEGYLIAAWTALEATDDGNGCLFYYPKSHRLPFVSCEDYASGNTKWTLGEYSYKNYEDKIDAVIQEQRLQKVNFHAEAGDVFIWHANLLHGGNPITQAGRTRKSMVAHYFSEDVICYHEISQRPALMGG